uniref:Mixed lineage kinase domain like pseudokinase n=1 Tax=Anas platyrhynchos TaxID=8839 RepID=A0A8B9TRA0_ANAPL
MDIVERVLCVAQAIHSQFEHVKCCKHQCQRLVERIQILLEPVRILQSQPWWHISHHEEQMLKKLLQALEEAQKLVTKYSQASWIQKFLSARSSGEEFVWGLSLLLQADPPQPSCGPVVSAGESPRALESRRETKHVPPTHLHACPLPGTEEPRDGAREIYMDRQCMEDKVDWMQSELSKIVPGLKKVNVGKREDITEIERDQLTFYRHLQDTERYDLYEGEYLKYPVAIKTFKRPLTTDTTKVRDIFEKEIQTLKKFESPNILRMYGICIEEKDGSPCFSIVMEYCKHGTLREVLTKQCHLSWEIRIRMALGAARGLYRLHQTEEKSRLHGCICSNKFLVAGDYCCEGKDHLSGFELCETESSIKRKAKKNWNQVSMLAYVAPENLKDIYYPYKRSCEIYSFGIVLWEIATSKIPFEDKICDHQYQDPVGDDCPEELRKIIDECRAFDPSHAPVC